MLLEQGLAALGIVLTAAAQARLLDYAALLGKWNRTYSLTALSDSLPAASSLRSALEHLLAHAAREE